jgi:hypothetical protein
LARRAVIGFVVALSIAGARAQDFRDVFGVSHVDGKYFLNKDEDFLNEGADQVLATSSRTIKLYLTADRYPWNSDWPKDVKDLAGMAQTPYFKEVFAKPFHTYILTAYSFGRDDHYFVEGITGSDKADETRQFHDLTRYLLTTYKGTGKTFILQHWEGDWAVRDDKVHTYDEKYTPTEKALAGMIEWLNARQAGIVAARKEVKDSDVHVYGATEANLVKDSMAGRPGVANSVLPKTTVDLVSYSSWDMQGSEESLGKAVDYLASQLPASAAFGRNTHSVYLGEYGAPENELGANVVNAHINNAISVVKSRQIPYALYWEIYCNENQSKTTPPVTKDEDVKGFWLVKPDGHPGMAWHRYRRLLAAPLEKGKLLFEDKFDRADSKQDIGPGWKQNAHYGPISGELKNHRFAVTLVDGSTIPWTSATLDLTNAKVLGRGLKIGEYAQITMRRTGEAGSLGVELYDSDQLRQGAAIEAGNSPVQAWNGKTWEAFSIDDKGAVEKFDWTKEHMLGVRLDSADGHFATYSYFVDDQYAGSWLIRVGNRTLDKFGMFAQTRTNGSTMEFTDLRIYGAAR